MGYMEEYARWREWAQDAEVSAELRDIDGDDGAIRSRFAVEMSFGTAGLRSRLGAGPGRGALRLRWVPSTCAPRRRCPPSSRPTSLYGSHQGTLRPPRRMLPFSLSL